MTRVTGLSPGAAEVYAQMMPWFPKMMQLDE
jgi:hypothetical protein